MTSPKGTAPDDARKDNEAPPEDPGDLQPTRHPGRPERQGDYGRTGQPGNPFQTDRPGQEGHEYNR